MPSSIIRAFVNSTNGLKSAWSEDASFRRSLFQVIAGITIASILAFWLDLSVNSWLVLVATTLPILIVELLNTAIEAVTDKASPERHPLAKKAKDIGSAAVLVTRLMTGLCWAVVILNGLAEK